MQTELAAIMQAMQYAISSQRNHVRILTDSLSSIAVLKNDDLSDNIKVVTTILASVKRLHEAGKTVEFVWVPSHIGIPGNEAADAAANDGLLLPAVTLDIPASRAQVRSAARRAAHAVLVAQHRAEHLRGSPSATWYTQATGLERLCIPVSTPRCLTAAVHRLRLGYPCWDPLQGDLRTCEYCGEDTEEPLCHYMLACPSTDGLRALLGVPATTPPLAHTRDAAAALVRRLQRNDAALDFLRITTPPR